MISARETFEQTPKTPDQIIEEYKSGLTFETYDSTEAFESVVRDTTALMGRQQVHAEAVTKVQNEVNSGNVSVLATSQLRIAERLVGNHLDRMMQKSEGAGTLAPLYAAYYEQVVPLSASLTEAHRIQGAEKPHKAAAKTLTQLRQHAINRRIQLH